MSGSFRTRGHAPALGVIRRAVERERPPHALLLVGPPQAGKTTLALDLAAGLLCLAPSAQQRPCRACAACRKVDHGNHPDLHRLAPEGAGGQIRLAGIHALASELALLPVEGRFRVAVIEGAHRLNIDAQNALLKTLEEPLPRVTLVLAADESSSLLPTVVSRCARLRLGPAPPAAIAELLGEAGLADAARASRLARLAAGRPGLALALAANPEAVLAHERLFGRLIGLLDADRRTRLGAAQELIDGAAAVSAEVTPAAEADDLPVETRRRGRSSPRPTPAERRAAVIQLLAVWRDVARDLALAGHGAVAELRMHELVDELTERAAAVDDASVTDFLVRLEGAARAVEAYANPELVVDALLLAWPRQRRAA